MRIPDHLTCLLRNLYAGQEATVITGHGTPGWFQIWKGECQVYILSVCLFNIYAECIRQNVRLWHISHLLVPLAGLLLFCSVHQALKWPPMLGSFFVARCIRHLKGPPGWVPPYCSMCQVLKWPPPEVGGVLLCCWACQALKGTPDWGPSLLGVSGT